MIHVHTIEEFKKLCAEAQQQRSQDARGWQYSFTSLGLSQYASHQPIEDIHRAAVVAHLADVSAHVIGVYPDLRNQWEAERGLAHARAEAVRLEAARVASVKYWQERGRLLKWERVSDGLVYGKIKIEWTGNRENPFEWTASDDWHKGICRSRDEAKGFAAILLHDSALTEVYADACRGIYRAELLPA